MSNTMSLRDPPRMPFDILTLAQETDVAIVLEPDKTRKWSHVFLPSEGAIGVYSAADKVFTTEELALLDDSYMVMFDIDTNVVDYFIFSKRPASLEFKETGGLFDSVDVALTKGARSFRGRFNGKNNTLSDITLYPSLTLYPSTTLYPSDGTPTFIEKYIEPMISKKFFDSGWN